MSERAILVGVIVLLLLAVLHLAVVLLTEIDRVVEAIDLAAVAAATGRVSTTRSPPRTSPPAYPIRRTGRTGRIASTTTFVAT